MSVKINRSLSLNILVVFFMSLVLLPSGAGADSLWVDSQQGKASSLFTDRHASKVGDVITIIINESTAASTTGSAQNSKSSSVGLNAGIGWLDFLKATNAGYSDSFKAQGSQSNTNRVQGKVTVTVKEIKPEGLLLVSGTQTIKQNKEEQRITVTGLVRPEDVNNDNTVLSSNVANANIDIESKGPIGKKQRQGILSQILNFLF